MSGPKLNVFLIFWVNFCSRRLCSIWMRHDHQDHLLLCLDRFKLLSQPIYLIFHLFHCRCTSSTQLRSYRRPIGLRRWVLLLMIYLKDWNVMKPGNSLSWGSRRMKEHSYIFDMFSWWCKGQVCFLLCPSVYWVKIDWTCNMLHRIIWGKIQINFCI